MSGLRGKAAQAAVAAFLALAGFARPAMAQAPANGFSLDSAVGAPAVTWQKVDIDRSFACNVDLAPTAPGASASLAGSRSLQSGRWVVGGDLSTATYTDLGASSGHVGVTFTPAPDRLGFLQATLAAGFESGDGVSWDGGLWPVQPGSEKSIAAGLRWAPAPLLSLHLNAGRGALAEQEIGVDTAFSPALFFSASVAGQQRAGTGSLATLAMRWQPRAQSAFSLNLEADFAREFWTTPLPGESLAAGASLPAVSRLSGKMALARIDAPLAPDLTLHLGASLPVLNGRSNTYPVTPAWMASLTRSFPE